MIRFSLTSKYKPYYIWNCMIDWITYAMWFILAMKLSLVIKFDNLVSN